MTARMVSIGDYVDVVSGPAFKSERFTDDPNDVPLIKGENIGQGYIAWDKSKYWPMGDAESLERFALEADDIVLAMDRPWVTAGLKWAQLKQHDPRSLLVQRVARLRARDGLMQAFLVHVIGSATFSEYVRNIMGGTNVPHISGTQIKAFKFRMPSQNEQAAITNVLSSYDNLIENNRRRVALLEASAQMLYREWFVRLRFPGHEHAEIVNGFPAGWDKKKLGEIAETNATSYQAKNLPEQINYVDISSVKMGAIESKTPLAANEAPGRARRKASHGDIIWSNVRPNLKAYALILNPEDNDVFSTGFTTLTARSVPFSWLYQFVTTDNFVGHLTNHATGAGYPAVRPDDFERAPVLIPPSNLLQIFDDATMPSLQMIAKLKAQSEKLAEARDLLLPRLMSGEIAV